MTGPAAAFPTLVLVVDDEQSVIDVLTAAFKKHKLEVRGALSGDDALALLKRERFGCLVSDKNLPGLSGLQLIAEAKRLQPYCACLVMTGYPTAESVLEAMRLGATDYLEKPFPELGLVVQRVQTAMEQTRTGFEREALARTLREMRTRLKKSEEQVFQRQTELDVFVQVLELRVEEATRALQAEKAQLQEQLDGLQQKKTAEGTAVMRELREEVKARTATMKRTADAIKAHATRAGLAAQRPKLSPEDAQETLENLERSLMESAEELEK
ncbi:MAG: response regulator [Archangiaceae bacterium]|nr:response regulator [Archangiaceae bacterium]